MKATGRVSRGQEGDRARAQPLPPGWPGSAPLWALASRVLALTGGFPPACVDHSSPCHVGPDLLNFGSGSLLSFAFPDFTSLVPLLWASASCSVKEGGSVDFAREVCSLGGPVGIFLPCEEVTPACHSACRRLSAGCHDGSLSTRSLTSVFEGPWLFLRGTLPEASADSVRPRWGPSSPSSSEPRWPEWEWHGAVQGAVCCLSWTAPSPFVLRRCVRAGRPPLPGCSATPVVPALPHRPQPTSLSRASPDCKARSRMR